MFDPEYGAMEDHRVIDGERPDCERGYCCGCPTHPIAKPWGWNHKRWERHYAEFHPDSR